MPSMRVHELAKEFGMTSKELLDHLQEMKIPAKNHASTLVEAYVDKIRKQLAPIIEERQAELEAERAAEEAAQAAKRAEEEAKRKAEDEARRLEAEARKRRDEEERRRREAEVEERRAAVAAEASGFEAPAPSPVEAPPAPAPAPAPAPSPVEVPVEVSVPETPEVEVPVAETAGPAHDDARTRLEQAIAAEKARMDAEAETARLEKEEEERYRQMARQVEELERQKVMEEARAAVEAAAADAGGRRKKKKDKRQAAEEQAIHEEVVKHDKVAADGGPVTVTEGVTVGDFADAFDLPPNDIIKRLMLLGTPLTVNQPMMNDIIEIIADDLGREVVVVGPEEDLGWAEIHDEPEDLISRSPVVTVMGHVDHGKTSLLDAIRETGVAATEAGGITQHIGASVVEKNGRRITFIDTPGHEAFTAMRARGANITDIVILVVAADDGVMPQTVEAIHHAQAAGVPILVAVNKIDKDGANPDTVRQMLTEHNVIPEEWGGTNIFVNVSAKKRINIDELLEMVLLQADVLELKANPNAHASGVVIEAKLDKGRGPVATVLVQRGTLHVGDALVAGTSHGRVRALVSPKGEIVDSAGPAEPVEILGLGSVPSAGDEFRVFADERDARHIAEERALKMRLLANEKKTHVTLDDLFSRIAEGELKDLNLVVKADVQGSIEALKDALEKMDQSEVRINVIHSAVGAVTETDVALADASDAIIIGFNVRPTPKSKAAAEQVGVDVRMYRVIYQAIEDINAARVGLLAPEFVEQDTARIEVRELFRVPKMGVIAGSYVLEGEVHRNDKVRVVRDGTIIFDGKIGSLRRFKEDVAMVKSGYECGVGIDGYQDLKEGDIIEAYKVIEVAREA